jgi:hypothetical protein
MKKSYFPPNNPFKDILSSLKEELSSKEKNSGNKNTSNTIVSKSGNIELIKNEVNNVTFENKITQEEVDEIADWLLRSSSKKFKKPKKVKKKFDRPLNPNYINRPRNQAAIDALKNPLDVLVKDPSSKPIIIRTNRANEEEKKNVTNISKVPTLVKEGESLKITKVPSQYNMFTWAKSTSKVKYYLDYSRGKQFQPSKNGDEDRDIVIGLDFGTSSSKVTIRDQQARRSVAIKFGSSDKLGDYLLPSKIFLSGNFFHLNPKGQEFSNLKIKAISSDPTEKDIFALIAYMGLVIRHSRSYFFSSGLSKSYKQQRFIWRLNVGIPARTALKFDCNERFINISKAALLCSYGDTETISIEEAREAFKNVSKELTSKYFEKLPKEFQRAMQDTVDFFNAEAVRIFPEIMAQIHGFVRSNLWNNESNPHILVIDVGAGTVDISLCDVERSYLGEYLYTSKACMVEGLGVSNLVKYRVDKVLKASELLDQKNQTNLFNCLKLIEDINYAGVKVPSNIDEMFEGIVFEKNSANLNLDEDFIKLIRQIIWSKTVLKASEKSKPNDQTWKPLPVFLCGGGSRMPFYMKIVEHFVLLRMAKAYFDLKKPPQPDDLFGIEIGEEYDRMSVAYGLGYWDLGLFLPDFEKTEIQATGDDSPRWSDDFVSKDMT